MITLATLEQATAQEVFDQVAKHLLTQMEKSRENEAGNCLYRSGDLKCAAGCLMTDEEYAGISEASWLTLVRSKSVPSTHEGLIMDLQILHDKVDVSAWRDRLAATAEYRGLIFNEAEYTTKS